MLDHEQVQFAIPVPTPVVSHDPQEQALYEYWVQQNQNTQSDGSTVPSDPFPGITIDPKYQELYDYWVQNRLKTQEPKSFSEKISDFKEDSFTMHFFSGIAIFLVLLGALLIILARKISESNETERSRMTERAEAKITKIVHKRIGKNSYRYATIEYFYRGERFERECLVSYSRQEGQTVTVLFDPSDLDTIRIDDNGQDNPPENGIRIAAAVLIVLGIIVLVLLGI